METGGVVMSIYTKDHLGRELSAEEIVKQLSAMLGWGSTTPWHVLERDLAAKLSRLKVLSASLGFGLETVRPGSCREPPAVSKTGDVRKARSWENR